MNKGFAIAGGVLILLSILGIIVGVVGIAGHGPDSENILHDTELDGIHSLSMEISSSSRFMQKVTRIVTVTLFQLQMTCTNISRRIAM